MRLTVREPHRLAQIVDDTPALLAVGQKVFRDEGRRQPHQRALPNSPCRAAVQHSVSMSEPTISMS